jgi:CheY-like chemotaxis protein
VQKRYRAVEGVAWRCGRAAARNASVVSPCRESAAKRARERRKRPTWGGCGTLPAKSSADDLGGQQVEMFTMTSPTVHDTSPPLSPRLPPARGGKRTAASRQLVLVVDDFEDNRSMYAIYLSYSGYEVVEAADGIEAVNVASRTMPDIIVMDLSLPLMDGWEATRRLKANETTRHIPVIALTGHALAGHARDALAAGCDAFLAKPCLPETLVEKVQELISED